MKVNSINYYNSINFKHTAVPYPEYENYRKPHKTFETQFSQLVTKVSSLFSPEVTHEAKRIKSGIDKVYSQDANQQYSVKEAKGSLLSVLA